MKTIIVPVTGMHCASCASVISKKVAKIPGVSAASGDYAQEQIVISFDGATETLQKAQTAIAPLGYSLIVTTDQEEIKREHHSALSEMRRRALLVFPLALAMGLLMLWQTMAPYVGLPILSLSMEMIAYIDFILATVVIALVGKQFAIGVANFVQGNGAGMDALVGLGTFTAYIYSSIILFFPGVRVFLNLPEVTYFDTTVVVLGFIVFGKYLEARSKLKTGEAVEKLLSLQAKTARVLRDGQTIEVSIEKVQLNDTVVLRPGERVPVDGVVVEGESAIDEAMITGEPMPVSKKVNDAVTAGTVNGKGALLFRATKVGENTMLAAIIRMVRDAQSSRAPIQELADKISVIFVPVVLGVAVVSLIAWVSIGPFFMSFTDSISLALLSFVSVLVIACPCALGLATPTAIITGVGRGAGMGILVKNAAALQKLEKVNVVVVDKTGTLTQGHPTVIDVVVSREGVASEEVLSLAASLEQKSEHPLAEAILKYAKEKNIKFANAEKVNVISGKGVEGIISGKKYYVGSLRFAVEREMHMPPEISEKMEYFAATPVVLMDEQGILAGILIADEVKQSSREAIERLHTLGIKVIMATGDDIHAAEAIGKKTGVDEVRSRLLPAAKQDLIAELQSKKMVVAMAGDGINDAPALAKADVGVAMDHGTDIAIESADVTLLKGDIGKLEKAIRLSRKTMRVVRQNLFWAFAYNVIGIPLAAGIFYPFFGWLLNPAFAGAAMALSSVTVVLNSLRLKGVRV